MSSYRIAPAAKAALDQATLLWPTRSRASDGLVGDAAHRMRRSWHNPCDRNGNPVEGGTVCAFDLTQDVAAGVDAHRMVRDLVARGDQRIHEAISKGQIWTRARRAEGWRRYTGSNPHDKHVHVSVAWEHRNDTSPWWTPPAAPDEEDELTEDEKKMLREMHAMLKAIVAPRRSDRKDVDPMHISLADVYTIAEKAANR